MAALALNATQELISAGLMTVPVAFVSGARFDAAAFSVARFRHNFTK